MGGMAAQIRSSTTRPQMKPALEKGGRTSCARSGPVTTAPGSRTRGSSRSPEAFASMSGPNQLGVRREAVQVAASDRDEPRVRDPGAVVTGPDLAQLVLPHLLECRFICGRVVLDRDLRGHAAHRVGAAPMAGLDQEVDVRLEEVAVAGGSIRETKEKMRSVF